MERFATKSWPAGESCGRTIGAGPDGGGAVCSAMDFDHLLTGFFGTTELGDLAPDQLAAGIDRLQVQIGLERDSGRRFGLWCLAYMLGVAPDISEAFEDEDDREAAREFMDTVDREMEEDDRD